MLPKKKTKRKRFLEDFTVLVYGREKIGKSTFASNFDKALFLATEEGLKALEVYKITITSWLKFKKTLKALKTEKHEFRTIVIDTIDLLFKQCAFYVAKKFDFYHPSEEKWGKGWQLIEDEFSRGINGLVQLHKGVVFISHARDIEIKKRGSEITKTMPTFPNTCSKVIMPLVDIVLYFGIDYDDNGEEIRIALTRPTENIFAGDRTRLLPPKLPLNFKTFLKYFPKKKGRKRK